MQKHRLGCTNEHPKLHLRETLAFQGFSADKDFSKWTDASNEKWNACVIKVICLYWISWEILIATQMLLQMTHLIYQEIKGQ